MGHVFVIRDWTDIGVLFCSGLFVLSYIAALGFVRLASWWLSLQRTGRP